MRRTRFGVMLAGLLLSGRIVAADGKWLDVERPANWNMPKAALPTAPSGDRERVSMCASGERPATTAGDRALMAAGWRLVAALQTFGSLSVAMATSSYDASCRPIGYQVFAFVDDGFAGTLSPVLMTTRADGAFGSLRLVSATEFRAEFVRYDPAAPEDYSEMSYHIDPSGPVVVPTGK